MFKLLTEEEKRKVMHEYSRRKAVVIISSLVLVLLIGIVGLLPSYVLSNARQNEVTERTKILDSLNLKGDESELQAWLIRVNSELQTLSPGLDKDRLSDFIKEIIDEKIRGIRLTNFSWAKDKDKITFSINGIASNRQTLILFSDAVNSSGHFAKISLPISNLTQETDIDFQLKLTPVTPEAESSKETDQTS